MKKQVIGFVGQGFIGKNYANDFEKRGYKIIRYSLEKKYIKNKSKLKSCWLVFVAVPTPTTVKGFDDSILINAIKTATCKDQIVIIKSTIIVGTTDKIQKMFPDRYIIHSPEFLTEVTADIDAAEPDRNILGYTKKSKKVTEKVMNVLPHAPYEVMVPCKEAELVKYFGNCYFYLKIMLVNLVYDIAEDEKLDYNIIKSMLSGDTRIGKSHLEPTHKGGRGAGGDCFIKDMAAFREMYSKIKGNSIEGLAFLHNAENFNKYLLRNSDKNLTLLSEVYGKESFED